MVSYSSSHSHGGHHQEPLHSVQKQPSNRKPPPSKSNQPKVYNVEPIHFRELVQRLTGATSQPQPQSRRLQSAAPPPIQLQGHPGAAPSVLYNSSNDMDRGAVKTEPSSLVMPQDHMAGNYKKKPAAYPDWFTAGDPVELSLSPTTCSWFSFPMLSPGPLSNYGA